jgi:hypothetical protein
MSMTRFALFCLGGLVIMDATLARPTGLRPDYGQRLYEFASFLSIFFQQFTPDGPEGYPELGEKDSHLGSVRNGTGLNIHFLGFFLREAENLISSPGWENKNQQKQKNNI